MLSEELKQKLDTLPTQPGVYVMKDKAGEVVYVGKAVNLRARVAQYFQERSSDTRAFIPFLEDLLGDVEVMITPSEKDALLLENELIKRHRPRFNVKLRDDKNFISLRLSTTPPVSPAGGGPADPQGWRALLRPVRERLLDSRDPRHRQPLLPAPHLHRLGDDEPAPALPAVPDQALPGALRVQRAPGRVPAVRRRGGALPRGEGGR